MFKPLLSATLKDVESITYPVLASPKLDGIRTVTIPGKGVMTRNLKPIVNDYAREIIAEAVAKLGIDNLDGEIIVGDPRDPKCFNKTSSGIMSKEGEPDFTYWVFDTFAQPDLPFLERLNSLDNFGHPRIRVLQHVEIASKHHLLSYEESCVAGGYEGVMVRAVDGRYKFGRSTNKEGILLKIKRWHDMEATIIGFEERMHNANEATRDALGRVERSSHKDNMVPMNTLGALIVKAKGYSNEFKVGTGFDDALRKEIWSNQYQYAGKTITIKHQPAGAKDSPRFPVFLRFRTDL